MRPNRKKSKKQQPSGDENRDPQILQKQTPTKLEKADKNEGKNRDTEIEQLQELLAYYQAHYDEYQEENIRLKDELFEQKSLTATFKTNAENLEIEVDTLKTDLETAEAELKSAFINLALN